MRRVLWLKRLILPPSGPLLSGSAGLALWATTSSDGLGMTLVALSLTALYLLSIPAVVSPWLRAADRYQRFDPAHPPSPPPQAIVILDGGRADAPTERGGPTVTPRTLERIDEGARLARRTSLPILVTGYGDLMAAALETSFGIRPRWIDNRSHTTHENALYSTQILRRDGIERIYLVTHFWHLQRSLRAFRHAEMEAVAVPAGRAPRFPAHPILRLVPDIGMLAASYLLLHERLGSLWYRMRYGYD